MASAQLTTVGPSQTMATDLISESSMFRSAKQPQGYYDANKSHPFFDKLPGEVRNEIYKYIFRIDHPVHLINTTADGNFSTVKSHKMTCMFIHHSRILLASQTPATRCIQQFEYCRNPFTGVDTRILGHKRHVLEKILICRQFEFEGRPFYFSENVFHVTDLKNCMSPLRRMHPSFTSFIKNIQIRFSSYNAKADFPELAKALPNLRRMDLLIDANDTSIIMNKMGTLSTARGIGHLRNSFDMLDELNVAGLDIHPSTKENIDVNHPLGVGPYLKKRMLRTARAEDDARIEEEVATKRAEMERKKRMILIARALRAKEKRESMEAEKKNAKLAAMVKREAERNARLSMALKKNQRKQTAACIAAKKGREVDGRKVNIGHKIKQEQDD